MRVALCQTNCGEDVEANEAQVFGLLEEAASGGADLAALPEVWPRQGWAPRGGAPSRESSTYTAGQEVVTADTEFGRIGMSICYDVRFPELYRQMAVRGAVLVFVPPAFRHEPGRAHWE